MKQLGTDWFSLDAEEIKSYAATARGVGVFSSPGVRCLMGASKDPPKVVDIHRSHIPLLPGLSSPIPEDRHELPAASKDWLRPFQLEAVDWLRARGGGLLALDLGGGKTATATAAADLPVCVCVPLTVVDVWRFECRRLGWTHHLVDDVEEFKTALKAGQTDCFILPYSRTDKAGGYFTKYRLGTLIADEAHVLTKKYVSWTQAFRGIPRDRTILLTATPMRNRLSSLWGLLDATSQGSFGWHGAFRERYCGAHKGPYGGWVDTGRTNLDELAERLTEMIYKRTRAQMGVPLPEHVRHVDSVTLERAFPTLGEILKGNIAPLGAHLTILSQLRQHLSTEIAKTIEPIDYIRRYSRVVFWTWFKETAAILAERIRSDARTATGCPVDVITGESPTKSRTKILEEWGDPANVDKPRALIASISAAGAGIALSNARAAVFVDLDWTPLNIVQAEKRHHRFGSHLSSLDTHYLVAPGTIQDDMAMALFDKQMDAEAVFGEDGTVAQMRSLLDEEVELSETEVIEQLANRLWT